MKIRVGDAHALGIDGARIREFYELHWAHKIALLVPEFYDWQFGAAPAEEGLDHCVVALDTDSQALLGVMGLTRRPFYLASKEVLGAELTTWIVDKACAGQGIGRKIIAHIQERYDVLFGMGISDTALPIYLQNGFRYQSAIPRFLRVFNFDALAELATFTRLAPKVISNWKDLGSSTPFHLAKSRSSDLPRLTEWIHTQYHCASRSLESLQWRYQEHPVFSYDWKLVYADSRKQGRGVLLGVRLEDCLPGIRILHVTDCIGDSHDMPAAISFIHQYCQENQVDLADFYCTTPRICRFFLSSGWLSVVDDAFFQFPHLFHPVELRDPPTTSLIYWSKKDFSSMADMSRLYISKQDADMDRPTLETYRRISSNRG